MRLKFVCVWQHLELFSWDHIWMCSIWKTLQNEFFFCSHAKTFFLPRCQWKTSEPPEGRKSIKIIAIFLLNEVFPSIQKRVSNFESCLHLTAFDIFDPLHASWNIGIFTGFTDLNGASSPFRIVRIIWSWRCWHCQVLPGTARYCQVLPECGGAVAPRSRPNCRCPWESQASERWLPGSRATRIRTKQDYQDSCCLWSFMVLSCFVVLSLASEAQRTKNALAHLRSSMHIFHHLPSSFIIFHHLPSSSKSTWISHD